MIPYLRRFTWYVGGLALLASLSVHAAVAQVTQDAGADLVSRVISRTEGEKRMFGDGRFLLIKVGPDNSGASYFSMIYEDLPPGSAIPRHRHELDEEILIVQRGRLLVVLNGDTIAAGAGDAVFLAPRTWVSAHNPGPDTATIFAIFPREGMEQCFQLLGVGVGETPRPETPEDIEEERRVCRWSW